MSGQWHVYFNSTAGNEVPCECRDGKHTRNNQLWDAHYNVALLNASTPAPAPPADALRSWQDKYADVIEQMARLVPVVADGDQLTNEQLIDRTLERLASEEGA